MEPFDATDLPGVWAPAVLSVDARGALQPRRLTQQIAVLASEVDGVVGAPPATAFGSLTSRARHAAEERLALACTRHGLPLVLGAGPDAAPQDIGRLAQLEPGALIVAVTTSGVEALIDDLALLARAAAPLGLVLDLRTPPCFAAHELVQLAERGTRDCALIGVALPDADEESCLALQTFEEVLAVWVPGTEHATGHRFGASGTLSLLACLSPAGAAGWCELLDDDLALSLAFERRLQHFWNGTLLPLAQRNDWSADELAHALLLAGDWANAAPHAAISREAQRALHVAARELVPELF